MKPEWVELLRLREREVVQATDPAEKVGSRAQVSPDEAVRKALMISE